MKDTAWHGTPLGWAEYYRMSTRTMSGLNSSAEIAAYLSDEGAIDPDPTSH